MTEAGTFSQRGGVSIQGRHRQMAVNLSSRPCAPPEGARSPLPMVLGGFQHVRLVAQLRRGRMRSPALCLGVKGWVVSVSRPMDGR